MLWVTYAKRALSIEEVRCALAVRTGMARLDSQFLPEAEFLGSACAGLVSIYKSDIIRLVHYTTREYFEQNGTEWFCDAHIDITMTRVTYLSFDDFQAGSSPSSAEFKERLRSHVLYGYATQHWEDHAREAPANVNNLILNLLESTDKAPACSQGLVYDDYFKNIETHMTGTHRAAYFGLRKSMSALLERQHDINLRDWNGRTPLSWAARNGHEAVVELLLNKGAEIDCKDDISLEFHLSSQSRSR